MARRKLHFRTHRPIHSYYKLITFRANKTSRLVETVTRQM